MKFTIAQTALVAALNTVAGSIHQKSSIDVLRNVKIEALDDAVTFSTTSLDMWTIITIPASVEVPGSCTANHKDLTALVKSFKKIDLALEFNGHILTVLAPGVTLPLDTIPVEDYPAQPTPRKVGDPWFHSLTLQQAPVSEAGVNRVTLSVEWLRGMVKRVAYAAEPPSCPRQVLTNVLLDVAGYDLRLTAAGAYRLAQDSTQATIVFGDWNMPYLIPAEALKTAMKKLPKTGLVTISVPWAYATHPEDGKRMLLEELYIYLTSGNVQVAIRMGEGNYPDYRRAIPHETTTTLFADRVHFLAALTTLLPVAKDDTNRTTLSMNGHTTLSAKRYGMDKPMVMGLYADHAGEDLDYWLESKMTKELLESLDSERVTFDFAGRTQAMKVTVSGLLGFVAVVMPMNETFH